MMWLRQFFPRGAGRVRLLFLLLALILCFFCLWGATVFSRSVYADDDWGLRAVYDSEGAGITVLRDAKGMVQFDGLPYPGLVLYRPQTGVVYYQHPSEPLWLAIAPEQGPMVSAQIKPGGAWQPWQGLATRRWDVTVNKENCQPWFTSVDAAKRIGLTARDIMRVLSVLEWLNTGSNAPACDLVNLMPGQGVKMGLPVYWTTAAGPWQLVELVRARVDTIAVPEVVKPVDDAVRLQLLLAQFGDDERKAFLRSNSQFPVSTQVEMIEKAFEGMDNP